MHLLWLPEFTELGQLYNNLKKNGINLMTFKSSTTDVRGATHQLRESDLWFVEWRAKLTSFLFQGWLGSVQYVHVLTGGTHHGFILCSANTALQRLEGYSQLEEPVMESVDPQWIQFEQSYGHRVEDCRQHLPSIFTWYLRKLSQETAGINHTPL